MSVNEGCRAGAGEEREPDLNSWEHRHRRARDYLVPWVDQSFPLEGATVLEYGCGHGPVSCAFGQRAGRVIGVDVDAGYVREGRRYVEEHGAANVELRHHAHKEILAAVAEIQEPIDVFLLYAVLEHLTLDERLAVMRLAREVTAPGGVLVVCETPNRLFPFDHHTTNLPFFTSLPDDLARLYYPRSPRADFREAMEQAVLDGREQEALVRWGRGVSYHEFELVFDDLQRHVIATNFDPLLLPEREVHSEELLLARYMERSRPDLAPCWSRPWLDLILTPQPHERAPTFMRPWTMDTRASTGVSWTHKDNLHFAGPEARLRVSLPSPTSRVVVGAFNEIQQPHVRVLTQERPEPPALVAESQSCRISYVTANLRPTSEFEVSLMPGGYVTFVGYDATDQKISPQLFYPERV